MRYPEKFARKRLHIRCSLGLFDFWIGFSDVFGNFWLLGNLLKVKGDRTLCLVLFIALSIVTRDKGFMLIADVLAKLLFALISYGRIMLSRIC